MAMLGLSVLAFAGDKEGFKEHLQNHYKFYGFIRNYFTYDSHESKGGTADLFYWTPVDSKLDENGNDLNQISQFRFLSLTSRVGVDVSGYKIQGLEFGAKVEADFYAGLTGSTGTAQLRLRQAFLTMTKAGLGKDQDMKSVLKVGQAWHPMAADMPDIYSLETGAPFGPFSRTPLVQEDFTFGNGVSLTAAAIWQMQYTSSGPDGASANYMKYGIAPELYLGVNYQHEGFLARVGVDFLSIKPRNFEGGVKTRERMNATMGFAYLQYKKDLLAVKAKTTLGQAGEHFGLMSGYAEYHDAAGASKYAPLNSSASWLSVSYGKKLVGSIMVGYSQNLGTNKDVEWTSIYYNKALVATFTAADALVGKTLINKMFRIEPEVTYNIGKFSVGLEYMLTGAQYGDFIPSNLGGVNSYFRALPTENLHWVLNHRVQALVKFTF